VTAAGPRSLALDKNAPLNIPHFMGANVICRLHIPSWVHGNPNWASSLRESVKVVNSAGVT